MTNAEALKFAEEMHSKLSYRLECAQNVPARSYYEKQDEMLIRAIVALREQEKRENPKPLTLDELRQMVGKPVYLVCDLFGIHEWNVVGIFKPDSIKYFEGKLARVIGNRYAVFINGRALAEESYGTEWIAYRHKPEEVQK